MRTNFESWGGVKFNLNQSLRQHDNEEVHCMRIEEIFYEKGNVNED